MLALVHAWVRPLALTVLSLALAAGSSSGETRPQKVTFGFAPDPAVQWKKVMFDEQRTDFRGVVEDHHQITESELQQHYEKDEEGAWQLVQNVRSVEMEINGNAVVNPMLEVLTGHEIRLDLDDKGLATGHEGFRELMRRYERELDPATYTRVRQQMSAQSMGLGEIAKRNQGLGIVAGKTVTIGEKWGVLDRVAVQGSWTAVTGVAHFESWTDVGGIAGVKLVYRYDSSGGVYGGAESELTQVVSLRPDDYVVQPNNLEVSGEYTWVIDPVSGQPLYEVYEQLVTVPVGNDLFGQRGEIHSAHTWRWSKL